MAHTVYPLNLDADLVKSVRRVADQTGESMASVMRQSIRLGLQPFQEDVQAKTSRVTLIEPLSAAAWKKCCDGRDDDVDLIRARMATQIIEGLAIAGL